MALFVWFIFPFLKAELAEVLRPEKKSCPICLVHNSGVALSFPQAFLRSFLFFTSMVIIMIRQSYSHAHEENVLTNFVLTHSALFIFFTLFVGNLIFLFFHPQRRSLHDIFWSCSTLHNRDRNEDPINFYKGSIRVSLVLISGMLFFGGYKFYKRVVFLDNSRKTTVSSQVNKHIKEIQYHVNRMNSLDGPGWTDLHRAAVRGNLKEVQRLVENGADVNALGDDGNSVLKESARRGKIEVMKFLLDHGADVDIRDRVKFTPLHIAAEYHQIEAIELLLKHGGDVNAQNRIQMTALRHTANYPWHGDAAVADVLIKHGADMTIRSHEGCIPVYCGTNSHNYPFVESLLKHGADPNSRSGKGFPILYTAVYHQDTHMAELILKYKANPNLTPSNFDYSPLHVAVDKNNIQLAQLLLDYNADPNQGDSSGNTPFHMAALNSSEEMNRLLLKGGADPYKSNKIGSTPYSLAQHSKRKTLLELFRNSKK